jgi:potassium/hydrogen antiporter
VLDDGSTRTAGTHGTSARFAVRRRHVSPAVPRRHRSERCAPHEEILVESAPLDVLDAELLTTMIVPKSRLHSVSIIELRLPDPSVITLIIRDERTFVPTDDTQLKVHDELLIVTTRTRREATERRLRAVSRRGPLAHWFDEFGELD